MIVVPPESNEDCERPRSPQEDQVDYPRIPAASSLRHDFREADEIEHVDKGVRLDTYVRYGRVVVWY